MNAHAEYIYVSMRIKCFTPHLLPLSNSLFECPLVYHSGGYKCGLNETNVGLSQ